MQKFLSLFISLAMLPIGNILAEDAQTDLAALKGTWEATEFIMDGKPAPDDVRQKLRMVFADDTLKITGPDGFGKWPYKIKLDPTTSPKSLGITPQDGPFKGKTAPGIYELRGETLKLCLPNNGTDRPKEFKSTAGSSLGLFVMKRTKP